MSLAELCIKIASREELEDLLREMDKENTRFRSAIEWALGMNGEFPEREDGDPPYWWRHELRKRAGF